VFYKGLITCPKSSALNRFLKVGSINSGLFCVTNLNSVQVLLTRFKTYLGSLLYIIKNVVFYRIITCHYICIDSEKIPGKFIRYLRIRYQLRSVSVKIVKPLKIIEYVAAIRSLKKTTEYIREPTFITELLCELLTIYKLQETLISEFMNVKNVINNTCTYVKEVIFSTKYN